MHTQFAIQYIALCLYSVEIAGVSISTLKVVSVRCSITGLVVRLMMQASLVWHCYC